MTSPKSPEIIYSCYSGAVKSICERKAAKKIGVAVDENLELEDEQQAPVPVAQEKKQKAIKITELQQ